MEKTHLLLWLQIDIGIVTNYIALIDREEAQFAWNKLRSATVGSGLEAHIRVPALSVRLYDEDPGELLEEIVGPEELVKPVVLLDQEQVEEIRSATGKFEEDDLTIILCWDGSYLGFIALDRLVEGYAKALLDDPRRNDELGQFLGETALVP